MATTFNMLRVRKAFGRDLWHPPDDYGRDGFRMVAVDEKSTVIISEFGIIDEGAITPWIHASIAHVDHLPTYDELTVLRQAVWGDTGYAYQVFAPTDEHVNIHEYALHLWGAADGRAILPEFGKYGTI